MDGEMAVVDGLLQFFRRCCRVACRPADESRQAGWRAGLESLGHLKAPQYMCITADAGRQRLSVLCDSFDGSQGLPRISQN